MKMWLSYLQRWLDLLINLSACQNDENRMVGLLQINVFKSCAIGRSSDEEGAPETWTAYAHDEHHEKPKYSCVSLVGSRNGEEQIWYARIQSFVTFSAQIASGEIKGKKPKPYLPWNCSPHFYIIHNFYLYYFVSQNSKLPLFSTFSILHQRTLILKRNVWNWSGKVKVLAGD